MDKDPLYLQFWSRIVEFLLQKTLYHDSRVVKNSKLKDMINSIETLIELAQIAMSEEQTEAKDLDL